MYFRKFPHPANFRFIKTFKGGAGPVALAGQKVTLLAEEYPNGLFRVSAVGPHWKKHCSQAGLTPGRAVKRAPGNRGKPASNRSGLSLKRDGSLVVNGFDGTPVLRSPAGMSFGVSGKSSMFVFERTDEMRFYGMGEKMRGLELSGQQTKFWNTDIFADFHGSEIFNDRPDPMYVSIPYVAIRRDNCWVGLLMDNPFATFISTGAEVNVANQMKLGAQGGKIILLGAEDGQPDLYIIVAPDLPSLTRRLQKLVGTTPRPPAWALGYHQCRWGYQSEKDMDRLDRQFEENGVPCDGLWIDIDYMRGFRVFTFNREHFPNPAAATKRLAKKGRRIVPIIDPGVKKEAGYPVYESGRKADAFCRNPNGDEFTGLVWPGETVFPDFSLPAARDWWAKHVKKFAALGFDGAWLDMNDPSTGSVLCTDMLFNRGRDSHHTFHNQYALGMAMASRKGFETAHPGKRQFLLSRSGYTGISRYAALWTGDNCSNYHYLRNCMAVSMNLALSGVPFNGPDIGGFAGDTHPQLITDWMKTCFLFPFCRNHTMINTRDQEPWAFDPDNSEILAEYIRMRYRFRPYLYNLFIEQEAEGSAILRPLFYEFQNTARQILDRIDTQFMIGPAVMQAPVVDEHTRSREVVLPGARWFSWLENRWVEGGRTVTVQPLPAQTPMYLREGFCLPIQKGASTDNRFTPGNVEFHILCSTDFSGEGRISYVFDDGETFAYRKGVESRVSGVFRVANGALDVEIGQDFDKAGRCFADVVLYAPFASVSVNGRQVVATREAWEIPGAKLSLFRVKNAL